MLHSSQIPIVNKINLRLQGTTRNGEVMFSITKSSSPTRKKVVILEPHNTPLLYIFVYDLQKNHMRKVEIKEAPNRYLTEFCGVAGLDDVENLINLKGHLVAYVVVFIYFLVLILFLFLETFFYFNFFGIFFVRSIGKN